MLFQNVSVAEKRSRFRQSLSSGKLLRFPGSFSPLVSMLIEELGFEGIYVSGAVLSADLGYPDIGLTTLSEVTSRGQLIAGSSQLPAIIDIDTGFGEPMNVARSVKEIEAAGLCGCHLEDQLNPKRCGHLDNKQLVESATMVKKVRSAVNAKVDKNFVVIARTDARADEGLPKAIERARAYVDAGADMIFPEALQSEIEFEQFRKAVSVPLLANMTEFGKTPLLSSAQLQNLGFNLVIYPVTTLRLAMKAVEDGLREIEKTGSQQKIVDKMQTRTRLYELLKYEAYNEFDRSIYNFSLTNSDKDQN